MRCAAIALLMVRAAAGEEIEILPDPPVGVTALARAEYQKAEQAFSQRDWAAAEAALNASFGYQRNHITIYDLAAVHIHQGKLITAGWDMFNYFIVAPPPPQDAANAAAKARMRRIANLRGHGGRSGREYAKSAIASIRAGHFNVIPDLDRAFDETQDLALVYWTVLAEFRLVQASFASRARQPWIPERDKHMRSTGLESFKRILGVYFAGATDLMDLFEARRLLDEIDREIERAIAFEKMCSSLRDNPNAWCPVSPPAIAKKD